MSVQTQSHYDYLADYYDWMTGDFETNFEETLKFFRNNNIHKPKKENGIVVDLGAGSGAQTIPLAVLGYKVIAVDFCQKLLNILEERAKNRNVLDRVHTICGDLLKFTEITPNDGVEMVVCMGDTLTQLGNMEEVKRLLIKISNALQPNGIIVLTFQNLADSEAENTLNKFIPMRNDDNTIFTCYMEFEKTHVKVHELLYVKKELDPNQKHKEESQASLFGPSPDKNQKWKLFQGWYKKVRVHYEDIWEFLRKMGFQIKKFENKNGHITFIAQKEPDRDVMFDNSLFGIPNENTSDIEEERNLYDLNKLIEDDKKKTDSELNFSIINTIDNNNNNNRRKSDELLPNSKKRKEN
ncbi:S-adenosyl-L-methionine-dependent methyltransferase [Anaeromyces robustus]|uniref:S-adenosyl-L-methionine-dependent methyltransferase n=1 Tax=Anaeromyces robustus TaxID=1754192 RepID=A0A1Y1VUG6_9FUNG|nr:S-adenosyl-L-methionine-dependent methyltransferase [Anaeromyces robustus]|eukprot:ORX64939.1 S-adenosyl-L-methionine-dependent methyltransferase [Anaeromyces robustus]